MWMKVRPNPLAKSTVSKPIKELGEEQNMRYPLTSLVCLVAAVLLMFACSGIAVAQEITGAISITVRDQNGGALKGATVTVTDSATKQIVRTAVTDEDGVYAAR